MKKEYHKNRRRIYHADLKCMRLLRVEIISRARRELMMNQERNEVTITNAEIYFSKITRHSARHASNYAHIKAKKQSRPSAMLVRFNDLAL